MKNEQYTHLLNAIFVVATSKCNKGFRFLFCGIDIYSKYAWVFPLKDKKGITNTNTFEKVLDEPNRKPNTIWVDKDPEFYNRSLK